MSENLIKVKHQLGLVQAVWLHKRDGTKLLSIKRESAYGQLAYMNAIQEMGSIYLNPDGTCGGMNAALYPYWSEYDMSCDIKASHTAGGTT